MSRSAKREGKRKVNWYGLTKTGIAGYAQKSPDDQLVLFSKVVMENREKAIHRVWSRLDDVGRSVIMKELGCFAGENAPQAIYAQRDQCAREFLAEAKQQSRRLSQFIEGQVEHERIIGNLGFPPGNLHLTAQLGLGPLSSALEKELAQLKQFAAAVKRRLVQRGNWDPERMIKAQEYVMRRLKFLHAPQATRLTPRALADIYQLSQALSDGNAHAYTSENIRKAIEYFRKDPENKQFLENIERVIPDWTFDVGAADPGNSVAQKQGS